MAVDIATRSGDYVMDAVSAHHIFDKVQNDVPRDVMEMSVNIPQDSSMEGSPSSVADEVAILSKRRRSPSPEDESSAQKRRKEDIIITTTDSADTTLVDAASSPWPQTATRAIYITNLMWPIPRDALRTHLGQLASGSKQSESVELDDLYIDRHRTHAFAVFPTIAAARFARDALNGQVWPTERLRKPLSVDFVPEDKVQDWITTEVKTGRRNTTRWKVSLNKNEDGVLVHDLVATENQPPANAPLGPKNTSGDESSHGKQSREDQLTNSQSIVWTPLNSEVHTTKAGPPMTFQTVSDEYVQIRLKDMRKYYRPDRYTSKRSSDQDINRFSFAHSVYFVDRGREVFSGIRPMGREKDLYYGRQRAARSGGDYYSGSGSSRRGGSGFVSQSDAFQSDKPSRRGTRGGRRHREAKERERVESPGGDGSKKEKTGGRLRRRRHRGGRGSKADSYKPSYDKKNGNDKDCDRD